MNFVKKIIRFALLLAATGLVMSGCEKLARPALGNYPKDANPPGGPLKFYTSLNGGNVDSIRANFGTDNNVTYVSGGVGGQMAAQFNGAQNGFINYPSANDFGSSTDFTISFWINITLAQKDNNHAVGIFGFASSSNFWGEATFYADNNDKGTSDSMDLKAHFANGSGDNWDFAGYTGKLRWPHMYDGQWHNVVFTYSASTGTGTMYRDGVQFDQKTGETIKFDGNASQLILGGYQEAANIVDNYGDNTWMAGFPGLMDNVRLYGTALSASDVQALYTNKQ